MKSLLLHFFLVFFSLTAFAQEKSEYEVGLQVADSVYALSATQTFVAEKKGWNIFGFNTKKRLLRYIPGAKSHQLCEGGRPVFYVNPQGGTLYGYALLKMKIANPLRLFPKFEVKDNDLIRVDLSAFDISVDNKTESFRIVPKSDLPQGEYVIINLNSFEDSPTVWEFSIP